MLSRARTPGPRDTTKHHVRKSLGDAGESVLSAPNLNPFSKALQVFLRVQRVLDKDSFSRVLGVKVNLETAWRNHHFCAYFGPLFRPICYAFQLIASLCE